MTNRSNVSLQKKIAALHDEESRLKREIQRAEEELQLEEESTHHLKQQTNVGPHPKTKELYY